MAGKKSFDIHNFYDERLVIDNGFSKTEYHVTHDRVLRKFKTIFGPSVQLVFQEVRDNMPLDSELDLTDINGVGLVLKINNRYVELRPSSFLSVVRLD